jgi:hypothetical protein
MMGMHPGIELLVELGLITRAQGERADELATVLAEKVERGEMTLEQAESLAEEQAYVDGAERKRSQA